MTRLPFPKKSVRKSSPGDLIHSDVCGPMKVMSNGKARYFATFIDDTTRWCEVRLLKHKSEIQREFTEPDVSFFEDFGSKAFCLYRLTDKGKFQPRSRQGTFLGYSEQSKAYRVWIPEDNKVEATRDVKFLKNPVLDSKRQLEDPFIDEDLKIPDELEDEVSTEKDDIEIQMIRMENP